MSRTELRCDATRRATTQDVAVSDTLSEAGLEQKCGRLLARSPQLGELVQWSAPQEKSGLVWLVDHERHLACVHVDKVDGIEQAKPLASETVGWTALRPCNGSPVR